MRINVNCDIISFVLFIYFLICFAKKKFSIPYTQFYNLVNEIRRDKWFPHGVGSEAKSRSGKPGCDLGLLVLGTLRVLGRAFYFDDLDLETGISGECHRKFFHEYVLYFISTCTKY